MAAQVEHAFLPLHLRGRAHGQEYNAKVDVEEIIMTYIPAIMELLIAIECPPQIVLV